MSWKRVKKGVSALLAVLGVEASSAKKVRCFFGPDPVPPTRDKLRDQAFLFLAGVIRTIVWIMRHQAHAARTKGNPESFVQNWF